MTRRATALALGVLLTSMLAGGACNKDDDCPAKEAISPDGPCSSDALQCAYDLVTPSLSCDGTSVTLASSCTCASGAWKCPSPVSCGGVAEDAATEEDAAVDAGGIEAAPGD